MFKIGDFSKMSGLSIDTLYHYQNIGLLKPRHIDYDTNYRYYDASQLIIVNKIIALKDAGFSLEEIKNTLKNKSNVSLIDMLEDKATNLEKELQAEENRLERLRKNIFLIKNGGIPQMNEISIKKVEPILVASVRKTVLVEKMDEEFEQLWGKVNKFIDDMGIKRSIPCMMLYHNNSWMFNKPEIDVEMVEPISKEFPEGNGIKIYKQDAVEKMACIVHKGPFSTISNTYQSIYDWIKNNGYKVNGAVREIYHKGEWETNDSNEYITELQFPIQ